MVKTITVATDGSARNNPTGPAGWAWYVDSDSWACGAFEQASNNYAELCAVMAALKQIPEQYPLHILTDSQYITKMFGEDGRGGYAKAWRKNNWLKQDGQPPANLQIVKTILALVVRRKAGVKLTWVKGHNGHQLNTQADKLCTRMSELAQKKKKCPPSPGWNDVSGRVAVRVKSDDNDGVPVGTKTRSTPPQGHKNDYIKGSPKPRLRRRERYTAALPELDDEDAADAEYNLRRKRERHREKQMGKTVLCDSCGTPIHPLTFECKCSM